MTETEKLRFLVQRLADRRDAPVPRSVTEATILERQRVELLTEINAQAVFALEEQLLATMVTFSDASPSPAFIDKVAAELGRRARGLLGGL